MSTFAKAILGISLLAFIAVKTTDAAKEIRDIVDDISEAFGLFDDEDGTSKKRLDDVHLQDGDFFIS